MTVLWFNLGIWLIPPPGWRGSLTDWVMLLAALSWHTGYQFLYLPKVLPESRAGAAGGRESVLAFAGLYPAAPEPGCRLSSAAHLVRNWAPLGLNIGKWRDTCLKHVEGNLQVSTSSSHSLLGKKICTDSALWTSFLLAYAGREPTVFYTIALRVPS